MTFKRARRWFFREMVLSLGALVAARCVGVVTDLPAQTMPVLSTEPPTSTAAVQPTTTLAPTELAGQAAEPSPTGELTFHPTDPASVQLAAGRPQFVEFFAFW